MKLSSLPVCVIFLLTAVFSEVAIAQRHLQCNYTTDIDQDNDGLIEICDLNALNAIRYQLDGSGYRESLSSKKITAGCPQGGCNGYELHNDLDFNSDNSYRNIINKEAWTSGLGWLPISDRLNFFNARFEGNGHTIANLYINRPSDYVGLFKATTKLAKISDLVLSQINIKGNSYIGSLAGHNAGGVAYIGVEDGRLIGMGNNVGGLFGSNEGTILNGDVILEYVEGGGHSLGGLVGYNEGHITYSVADTSLLGVSEVGGLVGLNFDGVLTDSRAAGIAKGRDYIGGLVGLNRAQVSASNAEGGVISEGSYSGGLVGANHQGGSIADSRASGMVSGNLYAGGLVGWNRGSQITNSFTVNRVDGNSDVGGLVGSNEDSQISNTYSSGFVTGMHRVGGLVGSNKGIVSDSFANGQLVASGGHVGGLIGWNYAHQTRDATTVRVIHSYWDSEVAEISVSAGGSPRTTAQLKSPTTSGLLGETFERWEIDDWEFGTNEQYPILRHSEGSNSELLPDQHIMLSGLLVLDGLTLSPSFNPQTFDYRVNLIDDSAEEIRFSPTIANSTQTISILKDEKTSLPSVHNGETVSINLNVVPQPTLITIARHYRIWVIRQSSLEAIISSDRSDYTVSEGQRITFNVSTSEPDLQRVSYRWRQVSPAQPDLLKDLNTRQAQLGIDIPDDFVAQNDDETSVVLQVEVRAGEATVVRNTTMTVVKTDSVSISTLATPIHSEGTLTVAELSESDLSMETDGGVDINNIRYQWQYKLPSNLAAWQDIEDAMQMRYEIPTVLSAIDNISYRVWLDYRDNQGYRHRIVSEPISVIQVVEDDGFSNIYYLEDLDAIRNQLNGKYELVRDLDFNSDASYRDPINKAKWTVADYENDADTGWMPIGTSIDRFIGIFKGNGHTIFNLQINRDTADYQGLFTILGSAATVKNVGLSNLRIEGRNYTGGLVGFNAGTIIGSYAIGKISANSFLGGLAGDSEGKIINSYANVSILGKYNVGGLVGWHYENGRVINSYAGGDVKGADRVGGLIGINRGSITNSYATGQVSGNSDVGGLVGGNDNTEAVIINSYAIGKVTGSGGSLVASNSGVISASYWNTEISGLQGRHGSGQTTQQMQLPTRAIGIFEAWGDADWDFGNRKQYPILKYTPGPDGDACGLSGLPQCGELISPHLRYGLRSLATSYGGTLSPEFAPEFDAEEHNQSGIYIGTVSSTDNTIRLIPTTIEPTADVSFYIGDDETAYDSIGSGKTSKAIPLKANFITRIHIEVQGTRSVRYTLYIDYQNTAEFTSINYLEDLRAIHHRLGGSYKLARDLDFADNESYLDPLNRILWTVDDYDDANDTGWLPIGSESKPFAGSFDGNGHTISGLQINRDDADDQSLFGVTTSDALISNIGLLNVEIEGGAKAAGLISTNRGQVGYSHVTGTIRLKSRGTAGGLVASNDGGDIVGSYAISEVSGARFIGGLVGDNDGTIINSRADSIIMPHSRGTSFGGLVGNNRSLITNSYAIGEILRSDSSNIGGLVGRNSSKAQIINGYAMVKVGRGTSSGGLVGYNQGAIKNSYAIGELRGNDRARGSLVGRDSDGVITASYWNTDTIVAGNRNGIGQTSKQLQSATPLMPTNSIYEDWDTSDWDFGNSDQYPILKHTSATESVFECGLSGLPQCEELISPGLRYGLRSLMPADDATFSTLIDIEKLNQNNFYSIRIINDHPSLRLIPVAMESTARVIIIGTMRETIDSSDTSLPILLKNDEAKEVIIEVKGTQTIRYVLYLSYSYQRVIDKDGDGLVDINYLEDLHAIRHQLDGSGYRANVEADKITSGCPSEGCSGYELLRDLDFNDIDSYRDAETNMGRWTGAGAWQPIVGTFIATFKGNDKTIANLRVKSNGGLFTVIGRNSRAAYIDGIGLIGVDIEAQTAAGIATSCKRCTISNSYVIGNIEGIAAAAGLLNDINAARGGHSQISNSYFIGNVAVNGSSAVAGGLVGDVDSDLTITDSYVVGEISGAQSNGFIGGLVGVRSSSIIDIVNSYASVSATKDDVPQSLFGGNKDPNDKLAPTARAVYLDRDISRANVTLGESKRTVALQSPTSATDIYMRWRSDNLGNSDNWDFGTTKQYPAVKYNLRADFTAGDVHCEAADLQNRPDDCRTLLRYQGSLLRDLKLSEGAGLSNPFSFALFDYGISVNADRSTIRMLPTAFNTVTMIEVFSDGNLMGVSDSGEWTMPIPLNDSGDTVVALVVKDGNRSSYRYRFIVNRINIVTQNIDKDGDGLIDIDDAIHLNAIRHRLDGSAYRHSETADAIYCPNGCIGYELTDDIDLAGIDWQPIGGLRQPFNGLFRGNGHTIFNLTIKANNINNMGLFRVIGAAGRIENVGLVNVDMVGEGTIGSIAARNRGTIINSYAKGKLVDTKSTVNSMGGLVGKNERGKIINSYADVDIKARASFAGALLGESQGGSIVNSYATGNVQVNRGIAGGLVGTSGRDPFIINDSYAVGNVQIDNGRVGGLVAATISGQTFSNSYYRKSGVISGTDSLVGIDRTASALRTGTPSDDIYTEWDRADWDFGNTEQYPVLLYAAGDDKAHRACETSPTDMNLLVCGTLLPAQRSGLVQLELSENAHLTPAFNPEIYDYNLVVDSGTTFRTTPTAYYGSDKITIDANGLSSLINSGQGLSFTLSNDLNRILITVRSENQDAPTLYTIKVVHNITVVDGLIMIDYLEDLDLMRNPIEQISDILEDCPIDSKDNMRRCKGYKLTRDLDFKDPKSYRVGAINPIWTTGVGWQPIGDNSNPFNDLFNGNAHTISNLRINGAATDNIGLFSVMATSARVENVGLLNVDIDVNGQYSGALVGENNGEIVNSYVIGGEVRGSLYSGGLVGRNLGVIVNSHTSVKVTGTNFVGGLVGGNESGSRIYNSYATGAVSGNDYVGGLVGISTTNISNSYATGTVSGVSSVGGLAGWVNGSIINSYATSKISGSSQGLIGSVLNAILSVQSYWDVATSEVGDDNFDSNGIGKTTAELQTPAIGEEIYSQWHHDDWYSAAGQYPALRYTSATDIVARPACREAEGLRVELPICGSLLPDLRIGLSNLARSNEVLLLRPDFNSGIYDYELILKSNAQEFTIIPRTFNQNARVILNDDSKTNPREELVDNEETTLEIDNSNGFLLTLTVEDSPGSMTTRTTLYRFEVSKHPFITINDIDEDNDGLIDISSIDDLNAIRYQLDGSGYKASRDDIIITQGCPRTGCMGYELMQDLDLTDDVRFANWQPIGSIASNSDADECNHPSNRCFSGIFNGNNHTISNLRINRSDTDNIGLFVALANGAQVMNVNLANVEVMGRNGVGTLAAYNAGRIDNSYADGMVVGEHDVGGLVAYNTGRISNSYAYGVISGERSVGGLVARNESGGMIANSYSLSRVSGDNGIGGLVGLNFGSIANTYASGSVEGVKLIGGLVGENDGLVRNSYATADIVCTGVPACATYTVATGGLIGSNTNGGDAVNSYWDIEASNIRGNIQGSAGGIGKTTLQLQSGNSQSSDASGAYYEWRNSDWNFGNANQYPILKYASPITRRGTPQSQSYGLASLTIAEVVMLSPNFNTTKLYYRVSVELDANIRQLHLTPNALDKRATIRILSDNGFDEQLQSGTSSSAIVLHSTGTTVITVEVSGERRIRYRFEVDYFSSGLERDVDVDGDGLIDILTLEDLDAMRNALDGSRLRYQNNDGVFIESIKGCPMTGCKGYELLQNLDFDNPLHYRAGSVNSAWTTGAGWQPIGTSSYPFAATFKGNGYTISNLRVNRPDSDGGLFGVIDGSETDTVIEGLGLSDVNIVGGEHVGGLVGYNRAGNISKSYVTGFVAARGNGTSVISGGLVGRNVGGSITESYSETQVKGNLADRLTRSLAGGLVALNENRGRIENSYAVGSVIGRDGVGGLVASNRSSSKIINSYAVSRAIAIGAKSKVGGLVARNNAMVSDSYWDIDASGVASSASGTSATTIILQSSTPTSPMNSIYRNWDPNVWEFADAARYPALKAIANAPILAPEGKSLLQSLTLSGNVRLFPPFHPLIFDYDIIAESERITEVQLNATPTQAGTMLDVVCNDGLACASGIPLSFVLDGSHAPQITISTRTPDDTVLPYNFSVRYVTSEIKLVTATTTTLSMPLTVAEGERVRLTTPYNFGLNEDSYRYSWRQSVGDVLKFNDPLSPVDTQSAVLDFMVPINVVSRQDDSRVVQLILEIAVNDEVYSSKMISLIISKRDNDVAHRVRLLRDNIEVHTYSIRIERKDGSEFIDRDGDFAAIDIQWQRRRSEAESWINLVSAPAYALPNEGDYQYRAIVMYEDQQGYREQLESEVINYLDIDDDDDGLIEIRYLEELDAMRYVLDGSGYKADAMSTTSTIGCPVVNNVEKCRGYELMNDLDFTDDASYLTSDPATRSELKNDWTVMRFTDPDDSSPVDSSWQPIGGVFNAVFNGNGHTISNMQINYSVGTKNNIGLFSQIGETAKIENLGLVDPAIKGLVGTKNVGGIAGAIQSGSVIVNSYVVGDVAAGNTDKIIRGDVGRSEQTGFIGGLVGWNKGLILNSYAKINVIAEDSETPDTNRQVGVGGLVGRNIDGGKVYNSYSTGEVKGPCIVGGLVGNQSSSDPGELLKTSQIKNSYTTGNVETGFGTCSESNNQVAGGLVGVNNNSTIENGYTLGKISGEGTLTGLVGGGSAAINSYWNTDSNCELVFSGGSVVGLQCFGIIGNVENSRRPSTLRSPIAPNTEFNTCPELSADESKSKDVCKTYVDWDVVDWDFGTSSQFPALKYGIGLDADDPGCNTDIETALPSCDALLSGQIADALLLNRLNLSVNAENVRLTPDFMSNRFNYEAIIEPEIVPVAIKITANADEGTEITIRKDNDLPKQLDGTMQISARDSFKLQIKTAKGNNRSANYQIQVRLQYPFQPKISTAINGSTPTEVIRANILTLDEGDVVRLDASTSFGQNNPRLDYQWSQVSGKPLSLQIQSTSTLGFMVPVDFVARDEDDSTVILKLELSESGNLSSVVSREIPLSVRKVNNGNSESAVKWISSNTLSASDLSDDIDGASLTNIGYQWSQEQNGIFVAIPNANQKNYMPPEDVRNVLYRLSISYTDAQGYDTTIHHDAPLYTTIANFVDKDSDGLIEIETLEDLFAIRFQLDGSGYRASAVASKITAGCPTDGCNGYELTRSLDFMDDNSYRIPSFKARYTVTTTTDLGWEPIGSPSFLPFQATFNGNGYTISNLMINSNTSFVGLFGYTRKSEITNLGLLDVDIRGQFRVGSLVGFSEESAITKSYAIGTVSGTGSHIGGLVGWNDGGTITSSYAMGSVSGASNRVGGLVGNNDEGTITNSHAAVVVTGSGGNVGGLVGWNDDGTVMSSYATGDVTGNSQVGGLVGENRGDIMKSYATGVVVSQDNNAGGLVGISENMITNSYATGDVLGFSSASNLAGRNNGTITNSYATGNILRRGFGLTFFNNGEINDSYWLSGSAPRKGLGVREDAEKTAEELKLPAEPGTAATDVYYNWGADIWDFGIFEEYPALKYYDDTCDTSTPFADCGKLLLHQRIGLRDLRLEQNVGAGHLHLSPAFSSTITTYTVSIHADASELKIIPIAANPGAIIVADGKVLPADNSGYTLALNTSESTSTVISVAASNSVATEQPVVYKLTINDNRLPRISINAPASIAEGETLALNVAIEDPEGDELSYSLTTAPNLLPDMKVSTGTIVGPADLRYELNIPSDLLDEIQNMGVVDIVMMADDGSGIVSEKAQLAIVKEDNDVISIPTPTLNGFTYTIEDIDLSSDADGINPNPEIAYQWQKQLLGSWSDIEGATDASYTVEGIIGARYRVLVDYTDKQGYRHQGIVSPAMSAPQQFVYNVERSRDVVRNLMDRLPTISVQVRVFLEGLLR